MEAEFHAFLTSKLNGGALPTGKSLDSHRIDKKKKAVVCRLLATAAIMLSKKKKRKRKMWSNKWYLKRNISGDAHLLNELLETDVP